MLGQAVSAELRSMLGDGHTNCKALWNISTSPDMETAAICLVYLSQITGLLPVYFRTICCSAILCQTCSEIHIRQGDTTSGFYYRAVKFTPFTTDCHVSLSPSCARIQIIWDEAELQYAGSHGLFDMDADTKTCISVFFTGQQCRLSLWGVRPLLPSRTHQGCLQRGASFGIWWGCMSAQTMALFQLPNRSTWRSTTCSSQIRLSDQSPWVSVCPLR